MKSLQTKILVLLLASVLATSALTGFAGIYVSTALLKKSSAETMQLLSRESAAKVDGILASTETSVNTLAMYLENSLESAQRLYGDAAYREAYTESIQQIAHNHALSIPGSLSFFVRFNPEFTPPASGIYQARHYGESDFSVQVPTDILQKNEEHPETVDWWYMPAQTGERMWLKPYKRDAIDVWTIAYVVPLYKEGELFGVVGIGISFRMIEEIVWDIHIYDTGFAFIVNNDDTIMYHPEYQYGTSLRTSSDFAHIAEEIASKAESNELISYRHNGIKKRVSFNTLKNGMTLLITVPEKEINHIGTRLIEAIIAATFMVIMISSGIALIFSRKLIRQIRDVDAAAKQMLTGNLNPPLRRTTNDEAGELAESMLKMQKSISEQIIMLNAASYQDALTSVQNKNAYQAKEAELNRMIAQGNAAFGIAVFDVNYMKETNDTLGHYAGDEVLKSVCAFICRIFRNSPVYRIGGDEFAVVLQGEDLKNRDSLYEKYSLRIPTLITDEASKVHASCACGISLFEPETDKSCADVFKRADSLMYENKKAQKQALADFINGK